MSAAQQIAPDMSHGMLDGRMLIGGKWVGRRLGRDAQRREPRQAPAHRHHPARRRRGRGRAPSMPPPRPSRPGAPCRRASAAASCGRIAEALEARTEEMARLVALETGNALRTQARGEAKLAADIFRYFGGLAGELKGETLPLGEHVLSYTRREPLGVVGAIIPWNAPVLLGVAEDRARACAPATRW